MLKRPGLTRGIGSRRGTAQADHRGSRPSTVWGHPVIETIAPLCQPPCKDELAGSGVPRSSLLVEPVSNGRVPKTERSNGTPPTAVGGSEREERGRLCQSLMVFGGSSSPECCVPRGNAKVCLDEILSSRREPTPGGDSSGRPRAVALVALPRKPLKVCFRCPSSRPELMPCWSPVSLRCRPLAQHAHGRSHHSGSRPRRRRHRIRRRPREGPHPAFRRQARRHQGAYGKGVTRPRSPYITEAGRVRVLLLPPMSFSDRHGRPGQEFRRLGPRGKEPHNVFHACVVKENGG